jgi:enamine deaminase RidA (YjgF/YER057c/UK114 family)
MRHVVKSFVYLEYREKCPELNATYAKLSPEDPPARTTLGVVQVPGESRLEITCIAYADLAEK